MPAESNPIMLHGLRLRAPAKLNLVLAVRGRRPDGYHEIETLFARINLADELTFEPTAQGLNLTCSDPALPCGPDNLIVKAVRLLEEVSGSTLPARIHLQKAIPVAAGLGGGSSDAAAALTGLNQLHQLGLGEQELMRLGASVGSDVPFFLTGATYALGTGRGEQCQVVDVNGVRLALVLVVPEPRLSTKAVYEGFAARNPNSALTGSSASIRMTLHALRNGSLGELAQGLHNDLEPEAIRRCPVIDEIRTTLLTSGCLAARISGSGSAVFGLCQEPGHATAIVQQLRANYPATWMIRDVSTV